MNQYEIGTRRTLMILAVIWTEGFIMLPVQEWETRERLCTSGASVPLLPLPRLLPLLLHIGGWRYLLLLLPMRVLDGRPHPLPPIQECWLPAEGDGMLQVFDCSVLKRKKGVFATKRVATWTSAHRSEEWDTRCWSRVDFRENVLLQWRQVSFGRTLIGWKMQKQKDGQKTRGFLLIVGSLWCDFLLLLWSWDCFIPGTHHIEKTLGGTKRILKRNESYL